VASDRDVLDVADSLKRMGGDRELFCEFVEMFDEDRPRLLAAMHSAIPHRDAYSVHRAAHTLKGLVLNFSARPAADAAYELERMARAGDLSAANEALAGLEAELERLAAALEPFREQQ
jgi:HPt (histidine-containing phosphotransfer) domain-containing protein